MYMLLIYTSAFKSHIFLFVFIKKKKIKIPQLHLNCSFLAGVQRPCQGSCQPAGQSPASSVQVVRFIHLLELNTEACW